jgi:phosphoglycolate phosphatase
VEETVVLYFGHRHDCCRSFADFGVVGRFGCVISRRNRQYPYSRRAFDSVFFEKQVMLKLVIFDLDGTLVDAYRPVAQSLNYALAQKKYNPISDSIIKRKVGWGDRNLLSNFVAPSHLDQVLRIYRRHHKKALFNGVKFLPGAKQTLYQLKKKGYRLAIASNRPTVFTRIILRRLNVLSLFSCVLCADKVKRPKPSGDLLRGILQKFSLSVEQCLYVGDMTIDIETGKDAKVQTIAVSTGSNTFKELLFCKPYACMKELKELVRHIELLKV